MKKLYVTHIFQHGMKKLGDNMMIYHMEFQLFLIQIKMGDNLKL